MGLFERLAVGDLKFRLVLGPAAVVFGLSWVVAVELYGVDSGFTIGSAVGLVLAAIVAYGMYRFLP